MISVNEFKNYVRNAGFHKLKDDDPRSKEEPEVSREYTHALCCEYLQKLCVPKERLTELYARYLSIKDPKPCLVERTHNINFRAVLDVDFKLKSFCEPVPQTEEEKANKLPIKYAVNYSFGPNGAKAWFLKQQRIILKVAEEVFAEMTDSPTVDVFFSMRLCCKFHIYAPDLIINGEIAKQICGEIVERWENDPEYEACGQSPHDIVDGSMYATGLRMLGGDKGSLNDKKGQKGQKLKEEKQLYELIFGDLEDYQTVYPTVVGYPELNMQVLKKFSVRLTEDEPVNVTVPPNWKYHRPAIVRCLPPRLEDTRRVPARTVDDSERRGPTGALEAGTAELPDETERMILNAARNYVDKPEIKLRRMLHEASGTKCLVLVPQRCHFKGCEHTRASRNQDTMWILVTKHRVELRCYACISKPRLVLTDYNPPEQKIHLALAYPTQSTVAEIVYDFVENCMAASVTGRNQWTFFRYDYDSNIWREDQDYLHELITTPSEQLWQAIWNLNVSEKQEKERKKLLVSIGNRGFRDGVMDLVGRKLLKKWFLELGNKRFDEQLNQNRHLCVFSNGTWDWKKDEFRQGSPSDCSVMSTQLPYIPWADIPEHIKRLVMTYISNFQPEEEEFHYIMQNVAYALDPSNRKEVVFVFSGNGGNGKTAFMNLIVKAVGDYAGTAAQAMFTQQPPESSKPREDIMSVRNCRVLCVSELTGTLVLGTMKVLSGHDKFAARQCHGSQIKFYLHFITFILTNETPKITAGAADYGTWRRLIFAVFRITFKARPEDITDPQTQRVGMSTAAFNDAQETIVLGFLSLLVEYKRNPHIYPLPKAYLEEQTRQENKNSVYIRFLNDAIYFPSLDPETGAEQLSGPPSNMMTLFVSFSEWMKMRKSSMANITYDTFEDQMHILLGQKKITPKLDRKTNDMMYNVTVKDMYAVTRRFG